ncbi:MAG: isochorismatase family protein, partial [Clostridia bacterium]|nr:isochorismatase family protein [Clostridia bacterium]
MKIPLQYLQRTGWLHLARFFVCGNKQPPVRSQLQLAPAGPFYRKLPVKHCIKDSFGWQISSQLPIPSEARIVDKETFGSPKLAELLLRENAERAITEIELVGLCTDICVISNAILLKNYL